jgi:DNA-binding GntR family transcriptional regulator
MSTRPPGRSLSDVAYEHIADLIMRCELPPGEWVTEKQLATLTEMGLAPVRSAMSRLCHDGLMIATPRVGYQVTPMTIGDVLDLFDTWAVVGAAIMERAALRATDDQIARFEKIILDVQEQVDGSDKGLFGGVDASFAVIVEMARSKRLASMYDKLHVDIGRCFAVATAARPDAAGQMLVAEDQIAALRARDPAMALAVFNSFTAMNKRVVLDVLLASPGIVDAPLRMSTRPVGDEDDARSLTFL